MPINKETLVQYTIELALTLVTFLLVWVLGFVLRGVIFKRLHQRYAKEGIVIPYPIRAVNYTQEGNKEK